MKPPAYPFDEFLRHFDDLHVAFHKELVATGGKAVSFEYNVIRVYEYMKRRYPREEAMYKSQRFGLILHYLCTHIQEFDREDFAVYGSEKVGALVGEHVLRALHEVFADEQLSRRNQDPTPQEIMEIAARCKDKPAADA